MQHAIEMIRRLGVNRDDLRARRGKLLDIALGALDHQMHVAGQKLRARRGLEDPLSEGDIGHERAVHHIVVQPVRAGLLHPPNLIANPQKICRQQGRRHL